MNEVFRNFIDKNEIDIEKLYGDLQIYSEQEINKIIYGNRLNMEPIDSITSIADIIGYDYSWRRQTNNLADNFSAFFGEGSGYQTRSLGLLEYTSDEIIEKLSNSFKRDPMVVLELDEGKKIVTENGLHRYTVLRIHYLNELQKIKGNKEEEEEQLRKKYEIPVRLTKVDLIKTYCQFLIKEASINKVYVSNDYDENFNQTGKAVVSILKEIIFSDKLLRRKIVFDDQQLLEYTKEKLRNMPKNLIPQFLIKISSCCDTYKSFKEFINKYFSEEINYLIEKNKKNGRGAK